MHFGHHNSVQLYHHVYLLSISFSLPTTDHKTGANSTKTKTSVTFLQSSARTFRLEKDISYAYQQMPEHPNPIFLNDKKLHKTEGEEVSQ